MVKWEQRLKYLWKVEMKSFGNYEDSIAFHGSHVLTSLADGLSVYGSLLGAFYASLLSRLLFELIVLGQSLGIY
jgi:hypothetical protein